MTVRQKYFIGAATYEIVAEPAMKSLYQYFIHADDVVRQHTDLYLQRVHTCSPSSSASFC